MIEIDKILNAAIEKDASDVHLICGLRPMLRIRRELIEYESASPLTEDDMYEVYDYFVRGNVDKDWIWEYSFKGKYIFSKWNSYIYNETYKKWTS